MNKDKIINFVSQVKAKLVQYALFIFVTFLIGALGFVAYKITVYSGAEPTEDQIEERNSQLRAIKLDEDAVKKIEELNNLNISIESLFNNGRDNPFE